MIKSHTIKSISVSGGFLDGMTIQFNDHLNCIIGGRGTGKTTVIEFLRYALGQGYMPDIRTDPKKSRELERLIASNLGDNNEITIEIETQSGLDYTVKRKGGSDSNRILDESGVAKQLDFRRSQVFDAEIYSQNDIENAASDPLDQLQIIDKFREEEFNEISKKLSATRRELEKNAGDILSTMIQLGTLQDEISEIDGIAERLKAVKVDAGEDPEEVSRHSAKMQAVGKEKETVEKYLEDLGTTVTDIDSLLQQFEHINPSTFTSAALSGPNHELIKELKDSFNESYQNNHKKLVSLKQSIILLKLQALDTEQKIDSKVFTLQEEYEELLAHHQEISGKLQERDRLQKIYNDLLAKQDTFDELKDRIKQLNKERRRKIDKLSELCDRRYAIREEIAEFINKQLGPMIRVKIILFGNSIDYKNLLSEAMKRSQMQYARIIEKIIERVPPPELVKLVQNGQVDELMEKLEIDRERANKIIAQLQNTRELFEIETVELYDQPLIELKDGKTYKAAKDLSTGQKCTTILPILLLESVKPLIIDQPEDNLDNAFVYDTVVKSIRKSKKKRQLIFVTHNPNIPVLGDAEKVIVLHSDGRQGEVVAEGNVDTVKSQIETILEG